MRKEYFWSGIVIIIIGCILMGISGNIGQNENGAVFLVMGFLGIATGLIFCIVGFQWVIIFRKRILVSTTKNPFLKSRKLERFL